MLREGDSGSFSSKEKKSLLHRYIESVYSGKKMETWQEMLMQAYEMRALDHMHTWHTHACMRAHIRSRMHACTRVRACNTCACTHAYAQAYEVRALIVLLDET